MRGVHITLRMRLECKIVRGKEHKDSGAREELYEVMNEVVVDRGANPYLAKIECWERDTLITKVPRLLGNLPIKAHGPEHPSAPGAGTFQDNKSRCRHPARIQHSG